MNWHIGQEVAYTGPSHGHWKNGETGKITGIKTLCQDTRIGINLDNKVLPPNQAYACPTCRIILCRPGEKAHLPERYFVPLADISELKEILKEEEVPA